MRNKKATLFHQFSMNFQHVTVFYTIEEFHFFINSLFTLLSLRSSWWQQDWHRWDPAILWRPDSGPSQHKCPPHSLEVQGGNTMRVLEAGVHGWHGRTGVRMYFLDGTNNLEAPPLFCLNWKYRAFTIFSFMPKIQGLYNACRNVTILTLSSYLGCFLVWPKHVYMASMQP